MKITIEVDETDYLPLMFVSCEGMALDETDDLKKIVEDLKRNNYGLSCGEVKESETSPTSEASLVLDRRQTGKRALVALSNMVLKKLMVALDSGDHLEKAWDPEIFVIPNE